MVAMYLPVVSTFQWVSFLTLTLKIVKQGTVRDQVDRIVASFRKLRRRKVWNGKRGIFSIEIVKKEKGFWYVHLHTLIDSKWMDQKALSSVWREITGDSFVVYIKRIWNRKSSIESTLREVLKYQTKIWELDEGDKEFVENTFKHRRFVNSFGIEKPEKPKFKGMKCKVCGGDLELFEEGLSYRGGSENHQNFCEELNSS